MAIFKKLGWFFKQEKRSYIVGIVSLIIVAIVQLAPPKIIGTIIDEIARKEVQMSRIFYWVGLLVLAAVLQYVFRYIWRTNIWGGAARLEAQMRTRLFHHFTKMDAQFYQQHRTGDLMAHATNDLTAIQNVAGAGILTFVDSFITGTATIVAMMIFVDWRLTLLAIIPLPFLALISQFLGTKMHNAFSESQAAFSNLNDKVQESMTGMKVIKTFGQEEEDIADFKTKIDDSIKKNRRVNFLDALFDPSITIIIGLSYVLTIIIGGHFVLNQEITIGQFVAFMSYIGMLVWPMFAIGRLFNVLERGNASYDRVERLLAEQPSITESAAATDELAHGTLTIDLAHFSYPQAEQFALRDIHVTVPAGHTLGIVGKTGSGKTTLLKLLMREYDQYQGKITFNDVAVQDYTFDALLRPIGYVPQDHFLFSTTIRDNIRFAQPLAEQALVEEAARNAAIHDDILALPEQYDTLVGERGVSLSGGQKQRISIARALMIQPTYLLFDDALSAVDAKTEARILNTLRTSKQAQTTIITAHRLSSVMHADEIIVLDEGQIAERGTHAELINQNGWYQAMWEKQQLVAKIEGGER